jgi:hypothetical protein
MNETKKRGRPRKVDVETLCDPLRGVIHFVPVSAGVAQAYAMRVWSGQSNDLPRSERIERVMSALKGQNLPTEGIELP